MPTSIRPLRPAAAALILAAAIACADPASETPAATERDSVGVTIVENPWVPEALAEGWAVDATPTLTVGSLDGDPAYQLFEVTGGAILSDGRLAIVNAGSREVRVYDDGGEWLASYGGEGDGPGEFMDPWYAGRLADTLVVYDRQLRRVTLVSPDAGPLRSYPVGSEGGGYPIPQGVFADGSVAFGGGMTFSSQEGFPTGVIRSPSPFRSVRPGGAAGADFGEFPGGEMFARASGGSFMARALPYGRFTYAATGRRTFWLGTGDAWEILAFGPEGALERVVRIDREPRPVDDALRQAWIDRAMDDASDEAERIELRQTFRDLPFGATVPPYQAFVVDALDHLWVQDFGVPGERDVGWTVLTPAGHAVGRLTLPAGWRLLEVGRDRMLVRVRDELDVERLLVVGLRRPGV